MQELTKRNTRSIVQRAHHFNLAFHSVSSPRLNSLIDTHSPYDTNPLRFLALEFSRFRRVMLYAAKLNSTLTVPKMLLCNFNSIDQHLTFLALHSRSLKTESGFADGWRNCHANGLEHLAADTLAVAAYSQAFSVFFDHRFGESFEVLSDFRPLEAVPGVLQAPVEFLFEHESKKAAKDMTPYSFIQAMVD